MAQKQIALVNGPNLNKLGTRQPEIYGSTTLAQIEDQLIKLLGQQDFNLTAFQSNHEGAVIDFLQALDLEQCKGILINPGAWMMNGYGLYDALVSLEIPKVEVHISNIYKREAFRHKSILASICDGQITGLGVKGYELAAKWLLDALS